MRRSPWRGLEYRLSRAEDHTRCPRHRQAYACACQAAEHTDADGERLDRILHELGIRYHAMVAAPLPCPRCGGEQFCPACQPTRIRLTDALERLATDDAAWLLDFLGREQGR